MNAEEIKALRDSLAVRDDQIAAALKKGEEEIANVGKMHAETIAQMKALSVSGSEILARLSEVEQKITSRPGAGLIQRSLQSMIGDDEGFKAVLAGNKGKTRITMARDDLMHAAILSTTGSAGALLVTQRLPAIVTQPERFDLTMRDLLAPGRATAAAIEYPRETGYTNSAATVSEGDEKPQSTITFETVTETVKTIAHWVHASKQILDDVPQLVSYIDSRLRYGLKLEEEDQLIAGAGTGTDISGLITNSTAYNTAYTQAGDSKIDVLRHAITQVRLANYRATGIVVNPLDWDKIELQKDTTGNYIWVNVQEGGVQRMWRLPVVDSVSINQGKFLVGNFRQAAQIFDREDAVVEISTEDRDNFIRNMVTIRAEERLALAVYRPEAIIYGDFTQASD